MRRVVMIVSALAFTLVLAPTAAAAPKAMEWDQWCDFDGDGSPEIYFVATGNHTPGWKVPWSPGDSLSGGIFMGGNQMVTFPDGSTQTWQYDPPLGMRSRVTKCRVDTEFPDGSSYLADPAWIFFPPGAEWA